MHNNLNNLTGSFGAWRLDLSSYKKSLIGICVFARMYSTLRG
jgi:hypothetical protein